MDMIYTMVDTVLLTLKNNKLHVALLARDREPRLGVEALPGGRIFETDDDAYAAAFRILQERAGITVPYLEQLKTYTGKKRDSRRWSISIGHYALVPLSVIEDSGHEGLRLAPVDAMPPLPFDHADMVADAVGRVRNTSNYSSLPCHLAGDSFTIPQLFEVYRDTTGDNTLILQNFRRKIMPMDFLEPAPEEPVKTRGPSATKYRLKAEYRQRLKIIPRGL